METASFNNARHSERSEARLCGRSAVEEPRAFKFGVESNRRFAGFLDYVSFASLSALRSE